MTERESEELYQELRRKLEDYGSHPSDEVWEGIQKQLPPLPPVPAARPALQVQRRWMVATATLLLGLVIAVLMLRRSQPNEITRPAQARRTQPATSTPPAGTARTPQPADGKATPVAPPDQQGASSTASATLPPTSASSSQTTSSNTTSSNTTPEAAAEKRTVSSQTNRDALSSVGTATGSTPSAKSARETTKTDEQFTTSPTRSTPSAKRRRFALASVDGRSKKSLATAPTATEATTPKSASGTTAASKGKRGSQPPLATRTGSDPPSAQDSAAQGLGSKSSVVAAATKSAANNAAGATLAVGPAATPPVSATETGAGSATAGRGATQPAATRNLGLSARQGNAETGLASRQIFLPHLFLGLPAVQGVAVAPAPTPIKPSRWAVEVLAGPTVSHRQLSADTQYSAGLRRLERAALSYAGQVQVSYALTPRLQLATGLGYTEYATRYNYILRKRSPTDSLLITEEAIQYRDTYRYLTLPLQVRYELGSRSRLHYGLLGGSTLGLYLGGRTTTGTSCACEQQSWSGANSPYRRISVGITAGLYGRYQLAPRWTLLVQPSFTYSILSISKPEAGPARRPFAGGLLTGFSFDLP